jgi:hypothetical protein
VERRYPRQVRRLSVNVTDERRLRSLEQRLEKITVAIPLGYDLHKRWSVHGPRVRA